MQIEELLQWGNVVILVATAVWAVSKIRSTTERLALSIEHLRHTVSKLDVRFEHTARDMARLRDRVTVVETTMKIQNGNGSS